MDQITPMIRTDLNPADCDRVSMKWRDHWGGMSMSAYYRSEFKSKFTEMHPNKLRFFVRDFTVCDEDQHEHLHRIRLYGHSCELTGTCTFLGRQGCHVRATVNPNGDHSGVTFFFFSAPDGPLLATAFFYMHFGKAKYQYNPFIIEVPASADRKQAIAEILSSKQKHAAWKIECAWLRAKYSPKYELCKRLLIRDMDNLVAA